MANQPEDTSDIIQTTAGTAWCDLLLLVPATHRGRAVELMTAIAREYGKDELRAETRGYREGKQAVNEEERKVGYRDGWQSALQEIMGRCGSPAQEVSDPLSPDTEGPLPS